MKHIKLAIALLLLAALILSACHAPSPDPAETTPPTETTPAETTTTEATPAETTPAETTPTETEIDINKEWGGTILTHVSYQGSAEQVYQQLSLERENVVYAWSDLVGGFYFRTFVITSSEGIEKFHQNDDPWIPEPLANVDISKYNNEYFENNHLLIFDICDYTSITREIKFNSLSDRTLKIDIIQTAPTKSEVEEGYPLYTFITGGYNRQYLYIIEIPEKFVNSDAWPHNRGIRAYNQIEYTYSFAD